MTVRAERATRTHCLRALPALVASLAAISCGGGGSDTPATPTRVLTTITVTLSPASIVAGQSATASASGLDQNGVAIATGTVTWTSATTSVATVSNAGVVIGVSPGTAVIIAAAGGKQGQATLTVTAAPEASVT